MRSDLSKLIAAWIAIVAATTLATAIDGGWTMRWLPLAPSAVWHGQLWRLVTWPLVEPGVLSAVVTCMLAYRFGAPLAARCGDAPVLRYMATVAVVAGLATCALATLLGRAEPVHLSGRGITYALMIAHLRQDQTLVFETIPGVPMKGRAGFGFVFALLAVGVVLDGPFAYAVEVFATLVALVYPARRLAPVATL